MPLGVLFPLCRSGLAQLPCLFVTSLLPIRKEVKNLVVSTLLLYRVYLLTQKMLVVILHPNAKVLLSSINCEEEKR